MFVRGAVQAPSTNNASAGVVKPDILINVDRHGSAWAGPTNCEVPCNWATEARPRVSCKVNSEWMPYRNLRTTLVDRSVPMKHEARHASRNTVPPRFTRSAVFPGGYIHRQINGHQRPGASSDLDPG